MPKTILSSFEKATIDVVEYLRRNYLIHKKFRHKKDLLKMMNINETMFRAIEKEEKNIPKAKLESIKKLLINEFSVNPKYLETHRGEMFLKIVDQFNEDAAAYHTGKDKIKRLIDENDAIKRDNSILKKLVETQAQLIDQLKETVGSTSKNTSKEKKGSPING